MAQSSDTTSVKPEADTAEYTWAVRINPNNQNRIISCIEAGAQHNDFIDVFKLGNFYWFVFQGASKLSSGNFIQAQFEVKELKEFIQKKGRILKAIYINDKEFKGLAVNKGDLDVICEQTYRSPDFVRLNDLSKKEIDVVDEPSDTVEMKITKITSYLQKNSAILNTLPELVENGSISKESLLGGVEQIKENVAKLNDNLTALRELAESKPSAEKIAEAILKLHPYKKWNELIIPTIVEKHYMKITAVDVEDPNAKKPIIKIKLQKVIMVGTDEGSDKGSDSE
jgi:hypothetical protein